MGSFRDSMLRESADLIDTIPNLPFLAQTADGTIADEHFRRFTEQNYLRLREFERFLLVDTPFSRSREDPSESRQVLARPAQRDRELRRSWRRGSIWTSRSSG